MRVISDRVRCLGNRHFNMFVVGKTSAAVVECGVTGSVISFEEQWEQAALKPEIICLMAMHAHFDHVCGIPRLKTLFPAAPVAASPEAAKALGKKKVVSNFFEQDAAMVEVLREEGELTGPVEVPAVDNIEIDCFLDEGEVLDVGQGVKLQIIATPGHSPCSLSAYLPEDQVLFISDAAGFQISDTELFPIFFQGYELYVESIRRLMGFPAKVLALPHERIWSGSAIDDFWQRALFQTEQAFAVIRELIEAGTAWEEMEEMLLERYYRGNLLIYTPENIKTCVNLLVRRVQECL